MRRPYTAADVVSKRGTLPMSYPADVLAKKAFALFSEHFKRRTPSHTYGAYVLSYPIIILRVFNGGYITGWTLFRLPRWRSISKLFTFPAGNRRVRHRVHMNLALTLLVKFPSAVSHEARNNRRSSKITPITPYQIRLSTFSLLNSSTTANNAKNAPV